MVTFNQMRAVVVFKESLSDIEIRIYNAEVVVCGFAVSNSLIVSYSCIISLQCKTYHSHQHCTEKRGE